MCIRKRIFEETDVKNRAKRAIISLIAVAFSAALAVTQCLAAEATRIENSEALETKEPAFIELDDGEYAIPVEIEGGSGKAAVTTPAAMTVSDGQATLTLVWSSEHYDYMISGGVRYDRVNEDGYSTFEIPVTDFDEPMTVIADTTAMSVPHEIEYTLTLSPDEIMAGSETPQAQAQRVVYMAFAIIALCAVVSLIKKRRR